MSRSKHRATGWLAVFMSGALATVGCGAPGDSSDNRSSASGPASLGAAGSGTDPVVSSATVVGSVGGGGGQPDTTDCAVALERGCGGVDVRALQELLTAKGFGDLAADGDFGPATAAALAGFEAQCDSCEMDGKIEPGGTEWAALEVDRAVIEHGVADGVQRVDRWR